MRSNKKQLAALAAVLLMGVGVASAADLNEVAPLLVYPAIATFGAGAAGTTETFVTVTNTAAVGVTVHGSYISGDVNNDYCFECNFSFPLTGFDTETLVVTTSGGFGVSIESEDGTVSRSCPYDVGMIVLSLEDGAGNTITDNYLFGEQVVVNYDTGWAFSIPAIPFQGGTGDGDRNYEFNGTEYAGFPSVVAADFLAPRDPLLPPLFVAEVVLFTLNFDTQIPPSSDCTVNGFDAHENNFSNSVQFGCWEYLELCRDVDPEFCYPSLGNPGNDSHGWVAFDCQVVGTTVADGGVHGAIVQVAQTGTVLRPNAPGPVLLEWVAWGRLLYQSGTAGDPTTLIANAAPPGPWN